MIPPDLDSQVASGQRPRADYRVMADAFEADLVDEPAALAATGRFGRFVRRVAGVGPLLAWYCFANRKRYDVVVTDGEQVGLPFALLLRVGGRRATRHMMIVHVISTQSKQRIMRWARLAPMVDRFVVYSSWQREFIRNRFDVDSDRIVLSTFMVDTVFFDPAAVDAEVEEMVCAAGLERRDYPTLLEAVEGLDVRVVIAAASPWSKQADSTTGHALPANVEVRRFDLFELRELYASSKYVVMPLVDVDFQAGITTILEAMSMGRPVVCTRTAGQTDTIIDERTGVYVPPGDVAELRRSLKRLLDDDALVESMGRSAREWAVSNADVDRYAARLGDEVRSLRSSA